MSSALCAQTWGHCSRFWLKNPLISASRGHTVGHNGHPSLPGSARTASQFTLRIFSPPHLYSLAEHQQMCVGDLVGTVKNFTEPQNLLVLR